MGFVYYANHLRLFERGRCEYLRALGVSYQSVEDAGFILPVADVACRYKHPARFDDLLLIDTAVTTISRVRVRFGYAVWRDDGVKICEGETTHACLNAKGRPVRVPESFREKVTLSSGRLAFGEL